MSKTAIHCPRNRFPPSTVTANSSTKLYIHLAIVRDWSVKCSHPKSIAAVALTIRPYATAAQSVILFVHSMVNSVRCFHTLI